MRQLGRSFLLGLLVLSVAPPARAIDHQDSPTVAASPTTDLADLFTWMSPDGSKVILAMTVNPNAAASAKFATDAAYVFHTISRASIGATSAISVDIVCTFNDTQKIACMVGDPSTVVSGDASTTAGVLSSNGKLRVFAGPRRDPSFASLTNIEAMKTAAKAALPTAAPADSAGCRATAGKTAITALATPATNTFATSNVLAVVMEVDRTLLNKGGPILSVWAATHKKAKTN